MGRSDYLPTRQADLLLFAQNMDTLIGGDWGRYGASAADAANLHGVVLSFAAAMALLSDAATRSQANTADKNLRMVEMLRVIRTLAAQIRANQGVAPSDKLALGLTLPDTQKTPIAAPVTVPLLSLIAATPLEHTLRFNDQNTPNKRAKPVGAVGLQLVRAIGEAPPATGPDGAGLVAVVTRQPFGIRFTQQDVRKTAYYWGRWQTSSGLVGPWSQMASLTIAA